VNRGRPPPIDHAAALARFGPGRPDPRGAWHWIPHRPTAKQAQFLDLVCLEAMFGGAAGGGKSDALLMAALAYCHVPGYAALILRKTFADLALPEAIMDRAKAWLLERGDVHWSDKDKRFTFPSGATLTFGYLEAERDKYRYQSAAFQFIGFDELTQFPESQYRYLLSRLRRLAGSSVPMRFRSATNPGGIGHAWVKRRFIDAATRGPRSFVPALLDENPHIDRDEYRRSLAELDSATRDQLERGIWTRDPGGLVYAGFDDDRNGIDAAPELSHFLLALDFGFTDATSFTILGWRDHDPNVYVVRSWRVTKMIPSEVAEEVQRLEAEYGFVKIVGDIGGLGKGYVEEARRRFHLPVDAAEKKNKIGYIKLLNGELERGRVLVVREGCVDLIAEWQELPWVADHSKESDGFDNHCADGTLYGWRACRAYAEQPKPVPPPKGSREEAEAMAVALEQAALDSLEVDMSKPWWER
jgi:hypothetical protein